MKKKSLILILILLSLQWVVLTDNPYACYERMEIETEIYVFSQLMEESTPNNRITIKTSELEAVPLRIYVKNPYDYRICFSRLDISVSKDCEHLGSKQYQFSCFLNPHEEITISVTFNANDYCEKIPEGKYNLVLTLSHTRGPTILKGYFSIIAENEDPPSPEPIPPEEPNDDNDNHETTVHGPEDKTKSKPRIFLEIRYHNITENEELKLSVIPLTTDREVIEYCCVIVQINGESYRLNKTGLQYEIVFPEYYFEAGNYSVQFMAFAKGYSYANEIRTIEILPEKIFPYFLVFCLSMISLTGLAVVLGFRHEKKRIREEIEDRELREWMLWVGKVNLDEEL